MRAEVLGRRYNLSKWVTHKLSPEVEFPSGGRLTGTTSFNNGVHRGIVAIIATLAFSGCSGDTPSPGSISMPEDVAKQIEQKRLNPPSPLRLGVPRRLHLSK